MRPYTTYKAFGGIFAALSLLFLIVHVLDFFYNPRAPERPFNWGEFIILVIAVSVGVYIFVSSDKKSKKLEKNSETSDEKKQQSVDWKTKLVAAIAFILFLLFILFYG